MIRELSFEVMTALAYLDIVLVAAIFAMYVTSIAKIPHRLRGKFIKTFNSNDKFWLYGAPALTLSVYIGCHFLGFSIAQVARMGNMFVGILTLIGTVVAGGGGGMNALLKAGRVRKAIVQALKEHNMARSQTGVVRTWGDGPDPMTLDHETIKARADKIMAEHNCDRRIAVTMVLHPEAKMPEEAERISKFASFVAAAYPVNRTINKS